ncbi:PTS glucitol/sorbitol transporter subunit IIC [Klebsiella variicola]|uniref:PTS glucitol/sorbitol transporter subunit IIC n=1 Tax=Klebsiella variicola TaxID=244366 RepID=UPI000DADF861|nr:PTS glucitol/sorbitol transporter subunit IIC [Klebsiella variicola]PZZ92629.1 PTS sorbitol transporter subunit IIC [Klebsiella variicola]
MTLLSLTGGMFGFIHCAYGHFITLAVTVLPTFVLLRILLTVTLRLAGTARTEALARAFGRSRILTYGLLPVIGWLLLRAPGALALGFVLPEKSKPGFEDALTTLAHPMSTAFPGVVTPELVAWLSICAGLRVHGLSVTQLALRYVLTAVVVGLIRGIVTERIFLRLAARRKA